MRSWLAVFGMLAFMLLTFLGAMPQSALALTASQVYEQVKDSLVVVKAYDQQGKPVGLGSGVRLPSGDIITNYHVVKGGVRYTVGRGKHVAPATLKAGDPDNDLCLLTSPGLEAEPARLGKTARLKVGDPVYAVGAPQGLELSLSEGIISQLRGGPPPIIQTTVAISPGSSGGGLFNAKGELVGITTFYLKDGQSLNFALPVEWIDVAAQKKIQQRPSPVAPAPEATPKNYWIDRALELHKARDWPGLMAWSLQWTKAEPGNAPAWVLLGMAYYEFNRGPEAIDAFQQALRLNPDVPLAKNNLGLVYKKMGRYREAIEMFQEALRQQPNDDAAWANLAVTYALIGNRSAALEAVKELRRYNPQKADYVFRLIMP